MMLLLKTFLTENWIILLQIYSAAIFGAYFVSLHTDADDREIREAITGITFVCAGNLIATMVMAKPWMVFGFTGLSSGTITLKDAISHALNLWPSFFKGLSPQAAIGLVIVFAEGLCFERDQEKIQELMEKYYFYDHH